MSVSAAVPVVLNDRCCLCAGEFEEDEVKFTSVGSSRRVESFAFNEQENAIYINFQNLASRCNHFVHERCFIARTSNRECNFCTDGSIVEKIRREGEGIEQEWIEVNRDLFSKGVNLSIYEKIAECVKKAFNQSQFSSNDVDPQYIPFFVAIKNKSQESSRVRATYVGNPGRELEFLADVYLHPGKVFSESALRILNQPSSSSSIIDDEFKVIIKKRLGVSEEGLLEISAISLETEIETEGEE